jgi:hypothetical protein
MIRRSETEPTHHPWWIWWLVGAFAFAIRSLWTALEPSFHGDTILQYLPVAEALVRGEGFVRIYPPAGLSNARMPGMSLLLAASLRTFGNLDCLFLLQVLADSLTAALVAIWTARLAGFRWGVAAGLTYACLPAAFSWTAVLGTETLTTACLTGICWAALQPAPVWAATAACLLAFGLNLRPDVALFVPLLLLARWPVRWRLGAITLLMLLLLPWTLRNVTAFQFWSPLVPRFVYQAEGQPGSEFLLWAGTWIWRPQDVDRYAYGKSVAPGTLPAIAFIDNVDEGLASRVMGRRSARLATFKVDRPDTWEDDRLFGILRHRLQRESPITYRVVLPAAQCLTVWLNGRTETLASWPRPAQLLAAGAYGLLLPLAAIALGLIPWQVSWVLWWAVAARSLVVPVAGIPPVPRYSMEALPMITILAFLSLAALHRRLSAQQGRIPFSAGSEVQGTAPQDGGQIS